MSVMDERIGRQRTLEHHRALEQHMVSLASRYGVRMPRSRTDGIAGPRIVPRPHGRGGPYVRAAVIRELLAPLIEREGYGRVAWWASTSERTLLRVMTEAVLVTVALADDLICGGLGDPSLWASTPGLEYVNWKGEPI